MDPLENGRLSEVFASTRGAPSELRTSAATASSHIQVQRQWGVTDMFRIGIALATTILTLSMIAASIGDALAQGNQRKVAPAARSAPAVRSAPAARPAPVARPSQAARPAQAAPRSRVQSAPAVRLAPAPSRSTTTARRAPQIGTPLHRAPRRIAAPRSAPAIQRATPRQNRIVGPPPTGGTRGLAIRNASKATIAGRNFSIWRDSHRVRHGSQWRTLLGLSTLGILTFGSARYYPYAYIDAPAPYCEGLTEDGCQLQWQEVPTLEGPRVYQCVAYCPWQ